MRLEELLNQYSDRLSENDLYIWDYVEKHKKQCENMTIEELARKCNVSRTTVLRFTKKLSLKGFGEFKVHLKMENDDKKQDTSKAVKVCLAYEEMMQDMVQQDFREISKLVYQAKRIFVYGTGMVQKIVAKEFKRLFYFTDKRFYDFSGVTEYETVVKYIDHFCVRGSRSYDRFCQESKDQRNTDHFDHKTKEESIGRDQQL